MSEGKTIAIFGAGSGLGQSLAHRFGQEGYSVALVARRADALAQRVTQLAACGIEAAAFPANLDDIEAIPGLVAAIKQRLGSLDVAIYTPVPAEAIFVPAAQLDAASMRKMANIFALAPIEIAHTVIPDMLARGDGAYIVVSGLSAVMPMPNMSGPGPAMAAARNHALTLHAEVMPQGVYAGSVSIGGAIERSEGYTALVASDDPLSPGVPVLNPDDIAEEIWSLVSKRNRSEAIIQPVGRKIVDGPNIEKIIGDSIKLVLSFTDMPPDDINMIIPAAVKTIIKNLSRNDLHFLNIYN